MTVEALPNPLLCPARIGLWGEDSADIAQDGREWFDTFTDAEGAPDLLFVPLRAVPKAVLKSVGIFLKSGRSAGRLPHMIARLTSIDDQMTTSTLSPVSEC